MIKIIIMIIAIPLVIIAIMIVGPTYLLKIFNISLLQRERKYL